MLAIESGPALGGKSPARVGDYSRKLTLWSYALLKKRELLTYEVKLFLQTGHPKLP